MSDTPDVYALLSHTSWIHQLAGSLVNDAHTAEDLVQDTWVAALEAKPDGGRSLRGWVATVLRNRVGKLRSGDRHRRCREFDVSRKESLPSTLDVVEKASTHRDLVEGVLALDEPYRETVLLRFFEQLSYEQIAERMGTTAATVNSRVTRGLKCLRERLDRQYGNERQAWLALLVPLAQPFEGPVVAATATKLMMTPLQFSVAAALSLGGVFSVWQFSGAASPGKGASYRESAVLAQDLPRVAGLSAPAPNKRQLAEPVRTEHQTAPLLAPAVGDDWVAELSYEHAVGETIRSVRVGTGAGHVEVLLGALGVAGIDASVRADARKAAPADMTFNFSDHVKVYEEDGVLVIDDAHKNNGNKHGGWKVSLVVRIPEGLGISAHSGAGDVTLRVVSGDVGVHSGAGDVSVIAPNQSADSIKAVSGAGAVDIKVASVGTILKANSGAGSVTVKISRGTPTEGVRLNSGAGSVHFAPPADIYGAFELESGAGKIRVPPSLGLDVERRRVGGRATGQVGPVGPKHVLSSGAGSVTIKFDSVH